MKALATFVDTLISTGGGHVAENALPAIRTYGLQAEAARQIIALLDEAGQTYQVVDAAEQELGGHELDSGVAPYSVSFAKPVRENEVWFLSTDAFDKWMSSPVATSIVRVATCTQVFTTEAFRVSSWDNVQDAIAAKVRKSPRRVVRDASGRSLVPPDVRPFLLTEGATIPSGDAVCETWAAHAAAQLLLALATEVLSDDRVEFLGPPRLTIARFDPSESAELVDWLEPIQEAARWVYDVDREVDLRHRLFSQEFARLAYGATSIGEAARRFGPSALEGAKITYGFHVNEISKDALKSLADLRKAVSEDTQKIFESVRQVALSAAGAMFYAAGLVAAKMASPIGTGVFHFLLLIGMTYIGVVIIVNRRVIAQQQDLRAIWRSKVYRYLTDDEYKAMVSEPNRRAELLLVVMLCCVLVVAGGTFVSAAWWV